MPTVSSRPSEELIEDTSLSLPVINSDNLGTYGKPNAIVRPVQRKLPPAEGNQYLADIERQILTHGSEQQMNNKSDTIFTKELDAKLKKLQKEANFKKGQKNGSGKSPELIQQKRPLFITTVPTGIFLQPTKDLPIQTATTRKIYAYSSHPRILTTSNPPQSSGGQDSHKTSHPSLHAATRVVAGLGAIATGVAAYKLRDSNQPYQNVMFDKRVIRGSNFTSVQYNSWNPNFAYAGLLSGKAEGDAFQRENDVKRRQLLRKKHQIGRNQRGIIGTPPPVKGRRHERVQTEKFLEELIARPPEADASCQTDLFLHRPPTPPYIPDKVGCDVATEILDGDLFDFDQEVQSILEALVGKSVEQSLMEVMHEEELADVKEEQQKLLALREAELSELRRLEQRERRFEAETKIRIHQLELGNQLELENQERITAAKLLQGHIADLLPEVLSSIKPITDSERREEIERQLGPWLAKEVAEEVGQMIDSRELLEEIVAEILQERAELYLNESQSESRASTGLEMEVDDDDDDDVNGDKVEVHKRDKESVEDEILYTRPTEDL